MATNNGAGQLKERVAFDVRQEIDRGDGVLVADWQEQFVCWAGFHHLRGGEAVLAARLQGEHTIVVRVRAYDKTKAVTQDWRMRDTRTGIIYAIKDIEPETDRVFISFTCQSGIAA